jgi:hypothetical protein
MKRWLLRWRRSADPAVAIAYPPFAIGYPRGGAVDRARRIGDRLARIERGLARFVYALHRVGIPYCPAKALHQLLSKVVAIEVGHGYALAKCHGAFPESSPPI